MFAAARRGAPWWNTAPLDQWTEGGSTVYTDNEFKAGVWSKRRDRAALLVALACASLVGGFVGVVISTVTHLLGWAESLGWLLFGATAILVFVSIRLIVPDVEVARYRQRRIDKIAQLGFRILVSLILAVVSKKVAAHA
jgi:zinc transporter ZupT